jgi:hypothetical protein
MSAYTYLLNVLTTVKKKDIYTVVKLKHGIPTALYKTGYPPKHLRRSGEVESLHKHLKLKYGKKQFKPVPEPEALRVINGIITFLP